VNATGRAGDVNPPVTVRAHAASVAAGSHRGRTGRLTSTARLSGSTPGVFTVVKVHGTLTCVSTQKLLCRLALRRGVFPTPSRSRLGSERDAACSGCQSPGNSTCPPGSVAPGSYQGRYRPIDIDRSPGMIGPSRVNGNLGGLDI
jgi:hypothetical protein